MATVDEHAELHAARASMIKERVHGSAYGAAGIEHVIHKDDILGADLNAERRRFLYHRR